MVPNRITAHSNEGATGCTNDPVGVSEPAREALSCEVSPTNCRSDRGNLKRSAEERSSPPPGCVLWLVLRRHHNATAGQTRAIHRGRIAFAPLLIDTSSPACRGAIEGVGGRGAIKGAGWSLSASGLWPAGVRDGFGVGFPTFFAMFSDSSPTCTISLGAPPTEFGGFSTSDAGGAGVVTLPCLLGTGMVAG
jgi:hypothetical protein